MDGCESLGGSDAITPVVSRLEQGVSDSTDEGSMDFLRNTHKIDPLLGEFLGLNVFQPGLVRTQSCRMRTG